jgi:hypothetical protein
MKREYVLIPLLLFSLVYIFCSNKEENNPVTPEKPGVNKNFLILTSHFVQEQVPSSVNIMFQVTTSDGKGSSSLTLDRFEVLENNRTLDATTSKMQLRKKDDIVYTMKTVLVFDVSKGAAIDVIKSAATNLVDNIFPKQTIALYTFSDEVKKVVDFTADAGALKNAISTIAEGADATNQYGAYTTGVNTWSDEYAVQQVQQGVMIFVTDGTNTTGSTSLSSAIAARGDKKVYVIGIGNKIDAAKLEELGNFGFIQISDASKLAETLGDIQTDIASYADSFYWISYVTLTRGASMQQVKVSVKSNENTGDDAVLSGEFDSSSLYSARQSLYINVTDEEPEGIDSVFVLLNDSTTLTALTTNSAVTPVYTWSSEDPNIVRVVLSPQGTGLAYLIATGQEGESTEITLTDVANNLTRTIKAKVMRFVYGIVVYEYWNGISGTLINDLVTYAGYPDQPTGRMELNALEAPTNRGDNFGARIIGYIHPPTTGTYTFWIASDDQGQLYLSSDEKVENRKLIAWVTSYANSHEWEKEEYQKSKPIQLEAGKYYYVEAIMKEGTGGDNLAVAWEGPGIAQEVIAGNYISKIVKK